MKKTAKVIPFNSCLNDELQISSKHALHYEVDGINLDDEQAVAKLRKKAEKKLDDAARAAITDYWSTLQVLLEDEMDEIQLYHLNNLKGELCYYLIEIPFGNARAWDVNTMKAVAASIQHKPDNPDKKSTIPDAIQRALIISNGSKEICFADLDQDYSHNQTESFLSLKKNAEQHSQQKDWSQENRKEIQQAFIKLSNEEKNDFLNLITHAIEMDVLAVEDHPLFETKKKFPETSTQKSVKTKSTKTSDKSVRDPNDKRPATMEEWRAMFPDKSSQETIDQILKGLTSGVGKDTSVNHAKFKRDTGISQKKQPQDLYQWLLACKTLYLSNVTQFDDVILHDLRPVSVFTQLTSLNVCISPVADPDCLANTNAIESIIDQWRYCQ